MEIKVIGFDLDGTLYLFTDQMQGKIRKRIYEKLSEAFDIPFDEAEILFEENYSGNFKWSHSGSRTIEELARRIGRDVDGKAIVQDSIEEADILDLIQPNPELRKMLGRLKQRFALDFISSGTYDMAHKKLERIGVEPSIFRLFLAQREYGSKSDGEVYRYWLKQANLMPEEILYVGDNTKQDIQVPHSLGINTCVVGKKSEIADFCIDDILSLEKLLK